MSNANGDEERKKRERGKRKRFLRQTGRYLCSFWVGGGDGFEKGDCRLLNELRCSCRLSVASGGRQTRKTIGLIGRGGLAPR